MNKLIYFENLFLNIFCTKSAKKKFAIVYNIKAPKEIDMTEIKVPTHLPNKIPEIINRGDPNPSNVTQITENKKNKAKFV